MKIVGTTDSGFLAQITLDELGIIMGFGKYPLYGDTKTKFKDAAGTVLAGTGGNEEAIAFFQQSTAETMTDVMKRDKPANEEKEAPR